MISKKNSTLKPFRDFLNSSISTYYTDYLSPTMNKRFKEQAYILGIGVDFKDIFVKDSESGEEYLACLITKNDKNDKSTPKSYYKPNLKKRNRTEERAKLVERILFFRQRGFTIKSIAKKYNITTSMVSYIIRQNKSYFSVKTWNEKAKTFIEPQSNRNPFFEPRVPVKPRKKPRKNNKKLYILD